MASIPIPTLFRSPLFGFYCNTYGVDRDEIVKNLNDFDNFQAFFTREVKDRCIDKSNDIIISPADG